MVGGGGDDRIPHNDGRKIELLKSLQTPMPALLIAVAHQSGEEATCMHFDAPSPPGALPSLFVSLSVCLSVSLSLIDQHDGTNLLSCHCLVMYESSLGRSGSHWAATMNGSDAVD